MQAHKTGSLIVVEDTQKAACSHGKGYVATHHQSTSAEASLLCYPVKINGSSSGFVVSVLWYKKHGFQKRLSAQYEKLLEPFRCRLRLEYYLSHLKGLVNEKHDAT
ncbi:MAG: hypothetical protein CVU19_05350 [Betaproteobacteria bacterium HGW-Betaproteobacteria-13]|nr:MAG: hypothetical protein CVU19_05350 [Betaproteobacteria bacterium HGW-Betaproteobacteria-13]